MDGEPYRFRPTTGWLAHLWKAATRDDHAAWEPMLRRLLPIDGVAIDVGAHGGQVTRLMARIAYGGMVIAVEPSGYARSVLRPALATRGARNVQVLAAALGAEPGLAQLRTPIKVRGDLGYGLAHLAQAASGGDRAMSEVVAVATLDAIVKAFGLTRLDFVKVDVEGAEGAVMEGARLAVARFRPALLVEPHPASPGGAVATQPVRVLQALGYEPHNSINGSPMDPTFGLGGRNVLWLAGRDH